MMVSSSLDAKQAQYIHLVNTHSPWNDNKQMMLDNDMNDDVKER